MTATLGSRSFLNRRMSCSGLSASPVIFITASSSTSPYCASNAFLSRVHDQVGVVVVDAEDDRLAGQRRVDVARRARRQTTWLKFSVMTFLLNSSISMLHLVRCGQLSGSRPGRARDDVLDHLALLPDDPVLGELGDDLEWRLVIHEPAVDHRLAVAVLG